jgi:hypothetical protein
MNKYLIIAGIILSAISLGGCGTQKVENIKTATVTKVGTISVKSGEEYLLVTDEGIVNITSNKVNLDDYLKKPIRVTGMFSGSTLYVDKVESAVTN